MKDMESLIQELSATPAIERPLPNPLRQALMLLAVCVVCGLAGQGWLGLRPDAWGRMASPLFLVEISCLVLLLLSCAVASTLAAYPDAYQRPAWLRAPYALAALLVLTCLLQLLTEPLSRPQDATDLHGLSCSVSIAAVAILPSALVMHMLGRGAVVHPLQAGSLALLTGLALGCLVVRLHEVNDSMFHVLTWHYLPTAMGAGVGVWLGRRILRW